MRKLVDAFDRMVHRKSSPYPNAKSVLGRCHVGNVHFNQRAGLGASGFNTRLEEFGFVALMKPSDFFGLIGENLEKFLGDTYYTARLDEGYEIASPYLSVDFSNPMAAVTAHEGRHRMGAISTLYGDIAVPVGIHVTGIKNFQKVTPNDLLALRGPVWTERGGHYAPHIETFFFKGVRLGMAEIIYRKYGNGAFSLPSTR